ncbi:MAG: tetratricopeptide repeat protein [Phycisphaerales bacterium]|nr:tetratricopeptide repeat protein [Phycisphaerales bacterium]
MKSLVSPVPGRLVLLIWGIAIGLVPPALFADSRDKVPLSELPLAPAPETSSTPEACPDAAESLTQARALFDAGQADGALGAIEGAWADCPNPGYEIAALRARIHFALEMPDALRCARAAYDLSSGEADALYLVGASLARAGRYEDAIPYLRSATERLMTEINNPTITLSWHELGECLETAGYCTAAADAYRRFDRAIWNTHTEHRCDPAVAFIVDQSPLGGLADEVRAWSAIGCFDDALTRVDQFEREYVEVADGAGWGDPRPARRTALRKLRCDLLLKAGRPDDALNHAMDGAAVLVDAPRFARIVEAAENADQVIGALLANLNDDDGYFLAASIAVALQVDGRFELATRIWDGMSAARSTDIDVAMALAACRVRAGDAEAALAGLAETLVRAREADKGAEKRSAWLAPSRGWGAWSDAGAAAPVSLSSDDPMKTLAGALALEALGRRADALIALEALFARSDNLTPGSDEALLAAFAHALAAQMLIDSGNLESAEAHADTALALDSACADAWEARGRRLLALGSVDAAAAALRQAADLAPPSSRFAANLGIALANREGEAAYDVATQAQFDRAARLDPTDIGAFRNLIETCLNAQKVELCRTLLGSRRLPDEVERSARVSLAIHALAAAGAPRMSLRHMAIAALRKLHAEYPDDTQVALSLVDQADPDEALLIAEELIAKDPENPLYMRRVARTAADVAEFERSLEVWEALARRFPDNIAYWSSVAELSLATVDMVAFDEAVAALRPLTPHPAYEAVFLDQLVRIGQWDRAADIAGRLAAQNPFYERRLVDIRVRRAAVEGRISDAEETLRDSLASAVDESSRRDYRNDLTRLLASTGRYDEAMAIMNALPAPESPTDDMARSAELGILHERAGRFDLAVIEWAALVKRIAIYNNSLGEVDAYVMGWLRALAQAGRVDEALQIIENYRKAGKARAEDLLYLRQMVLQSTDRLDLYEAAAELFVQIGSHDDNWREVCNNLAYHWVDRGERLAESTRLARRAVAADPTNSAYVDTLGWVAYKTGDFDMAVHLIGRAVAFTSERDPVVLGHFGDALWRSGRQDEAKGAWRKALEAITEYSTEQDKALREPLQARIDAECEPPLAPLGQEAHDQNGQTGEDD